MDIISLKETGTLIRTHRLLAGLTQFQLAESVNMDEKQLGKIERGLHYPNVQTFLKIIKKLNIDIEYFYKTKTNFSKNETLNSLLQKATAKELELTYIFLKTIKNNNL